MNSSAQYEMKTSYLHRIHVEDRETFYWLFETHVATEYKHNVHLHPNIIHVVDTQ